MKHLNLLMWMKREGLKQRELAQGLGVSDSWVSNRMSWRGMTIDEQDRVIAWAKRVRPRGGVTRSVLFSEAAA